MKILSYNINGFKAFNKLNIRKGVTPVYGHVKSKMEELLKDFKDYDAYCFQEVKFANDLTDYVKAYSNLRYTENVYSINESKNLIKRGYAGVLTLTNTQPLSSKDVVFDYNGDETYTQGRIIECEFEKFYLINVYVPNSGNKDELRQDWDIKFRNYLKGLDKPIILCGDMNVCATNLDYWGRYEKDINSGPGLMQYEIDAFHKLMEECNLVDCFRLCNGEERKYSWYSQRSRNAVRKNQGWRIDYFLVSEELKDKVMYCSIMQGYQAPDHSPMILSIDV